MISTTFLVATNSSLTVEFGGFEDLIHYTDESDNPQDLAALYIGSLDSGKKLQGAADPGVTNITITPIDILPEWVASAVITLGQCTQPTTPNGYRYQCTTAGTASGTEPASWPLTVGTPVTDGTAVWTNISPKHALTEVTLALDDATDLDTNTPGAALSLGNTILGGTSSKKTIYIRVENGVNIVSNNTNYPEIGLQLNSIIETTV